MVISCKIYGEIFSKTDKNFVLSQTTGKTAIESKFKKFDKPIKLQGFNNFCKEEFFFNRFVINRNLNTTANDAKYLQMFLTGKIE
jgi:hypothetical protein